jgi:hypothetical protein
MASTEQLLEMTAKLDQENGDEPATKKRKVENGSSDGRAIPLHAPFEGQKKEHRYTMFLLEDTSFTMPLRKKLRLVVNQSGQWVTKKVEGGADISSVEPINSKGEVGVDTSIWTVGAQIPGQAMDFELPLADIAHVMKLPVPEKAQKTWNYVLLPRSQGSTNAHEPILFSITAGSKMAAGCTTHTPREIQALGPSASGQEKLEKALECAGVKVTEPNEADFASATPESHRKTEKAYHVKAFRGSKDGFLFFLSTGIFFGFKKPLFFVSLEDIESLSYTSVLQRTFNIVINYRENGEEEEKEVEFSMLDQSDFSGINAYVQRHELHDASLAEGRRAKLVKVKQRAKGDANGVEGPEGEEDDGRTELEKAEAQLQDEEDEMEEDFELDSEDGDSDGSGESGDDEDYDDEGGNLVEEELGSEAEDVSVDEEDAEEQEEEDDEEEQEEPEPAPPPQRTRQPVPSLARRPNEPDVDDEDQL